MKKSPATSCTIKPGGVYAWFLAMRPKTWSVSLAPVLVGGAITHRGGSCSFFPLLMTWICALTIQIGTNLTNDLFDHIKGSDFARRKGPLRMAHMGLLSHKELWIGIFVSFFLAGLLGLYLISIGGVAIAMIGVFCMLSGIFYTAGPFPLGYHGLGDIFVMLVVGFAGVCGTALIGLGYIPTLAYILAIPIGSMATQLLVINNLRDRQSDKLAGKKTLVVLMGQKAGIIEYALLMCCSYAATVFLYLRSQEKMAMLMWVTLPWALWLLSCVWKRSDENLNPMLAYQSQLLLFSSLLLAYSVW